MEPIRALNGTTSSCSIFYNHTEKQQWQFHGMYLPLCLRSNAFFFWEMFFNLLEAAWALPASVVLCVLWWGCQSRTICLFGTIKACTWTDTLWTKMQLEQDLGQSTQVKKTKSFGSAATRVRGAVHGFQHPISLCPACTQESVERTVRGLLHLSWSHNRF